MTNSEFLEKYPLELLIPERNRKLLEKTLADINTRHVLKWKIIQATGNLIRLDVYCATTNFASAFYEIGLKFKENKILE